MTTLDESRVAEEFARASTGGDTVDKERMLGELRRKLFDDVTGVTTIGRFSVLKRLGAGASGVVFSAIDPQLERRVAIKLLRRDGSDTGGQRLIREARTLAKLSHPNIVAVHEVGEHDDRVFLALELVEGETLADWIRNGPHAVDEVVKVFLAAGRGLAAAHDAGLVHRDFKPANVLLDGQGRVQVADFGLARISSGPSADSSERTLRSTDQREASIRDSEPALTATGALVGTPAYMAPELFRGAEATAQSDQYAFCVALDEAFHQTRRYTGRTLAELTANVASGTTARKSSVSLPRRVRRALERGLSVEPAERFASMDALLAELGPRSKTWLWLAPGVLGGAAALAVAAWPQDEGDPCAGVGADVEAFWSADTRGVVEAGFRGSGSARAEQAFASANERIERLVDQWIDTAAETCALEHAEAPPSNIAITRRWVCLEHERVALEASIELLREPSPQLVVEAERILPSLTELELCGSDELLQMGVAPPPPPETRPAIAALEREITQGRALWLGTDRDGAVIALEGTVERARDLGHAPTLALALVELGFAHIELQESSAALASFRAAALAADRGGADLLRGGATEEAARKLADLGRFDEANDALASAQAVLDRISVGPGFHRARLEIGKAWVAEQSGDWQEALLRYRKAKVLLEDSKGRTRADSVTTALDGEARMLGKLGKNDEAIVGYKAVIAQTTAHLGDASMMLGKLHASLGGAYIRVGKLELAAQSFSHAYDIKRLYVEDDDPAMAPLHLNIAGLAFRDGDYEGALARFEDALVAARNGEDRSNPLGLSAMGNIAACHSRMGRYEDALDMQRQVLAERTELLGPSHISTAHSRAAVAMTLLMLERGDEARTPLLTALADTEAIVGPEHEDVAWILLGLAGVYEQAEQPREVLKIVERIEGLAKSITVSDGELCTLHNAKAVAWRQLKRPRAQWAELAEQAAQECVDGHLEDRAGEIRAWVET